METHPAGSDGRSRGRILVVDDEPELTAALTKMLARQGYATTGATSASAALDTLTRQRFDVLLTDLMMPEVDGLHLLERALEIDPDLTVIMMTGQGTVQTAVEAMKRGAADYLLKPFKLNTILVVLERCLELRQLRDENLQLRAMLQIYELGQMVAVTRDTSLILEKTAIAVLEQCQASEASVLLPVEGRPELEIVCAFGPERQGVVGERVPVDGTISGWVARQHEPLLLSGEVNDTRFTPLYPRAEIRAAVSLPMMQGNHLVGIFNVNETRQSRQFTPAQIRAMQVLINIAAAALENARLYHQTEKRLDRLAALRTIDLAITSSLNLSVVLSIVLDQVVAHLGAHAAAILTYHPQSQVLKFAAGRGFKTHLAEEMSTLLGSGYAGLAALERKTLRVMTSAEGLPDNDWQRLSDAEGFRDACSAPLIAKGEVQGVLQVFSRERLPDSPEWSDFLAALAGQTAIAIDNTHLFENLKITNQQLQIAYNATIEGWSAALDLRDRETEGHTLRVTEMTLRLAEAVGGFSEQELVHVRWGSLLHDIGKMGVPDSILLKPGPLSEDEWAVMHRHPEYAYQLLQPIAHLRKSLDIPYCHHERWDGSGYPRGLVAEQIPLVARIFTVVDVWDALSSDRPYRQSWPESEVVHYIDDGAGVLFDPWIVKIFLQLVGAPANRG